jgi:hypothetical protein
MIAVLTVERSVASNVALCTAAGNQNLNFQLLKSEINYGRI